MQVSSTPPPPQLAVSIAAVGDDAAPAVDALRERPSFLLAQAAALAADDAALAPVVAMLAAPAPQMRLEAVLALLHYMKTSGLTGPREPPAFWSPVTRLLTAGSLDDLLQHACNDATVEPTVRLLLETMLDVSAVSAWPEIKDVCMELVGNLAQFAGPDAAQVQRATLDVLASSHHREAFERPSEVATLLLDLFPRASSREFFSAVEPFVGAEDAPRFAARAREALREARVPAALSLLARCALLQPSLVAQVQADLLARVLQTVSCSADEYAVACQGLALVAVHQHHMRTADAAPLFWQLVDFAATRTRCTSAFFECVSALHSVLRDTDLRLARVASDARRSSDSFANVVRLIGQLTPVSRELTRTLMDLCSTPLAARDTVVCEQLSVIAARATDEDLFESVTSFLANLFRRIVAGSADAEESLLLQNHLPAFFLHIARNQQLRDLRALYLVAQARLFVSLAHQILSRGPSGTELTGVVGSLLPCLGELASHVGRSLLESAAADAETRATHRKLFRSVWYCCVALGFPLRDSWILEWYTGLSQWARVMPPLVDAQLSTSVLESEAELQQSFLASLSPAEAAEMREELAAQLSGGLSAVPNAPAITGRLTLPQLVFLVSVYHLETMRVTAPSWAVDRSLWPYLHDFPQQSREISAIVGAIADAVMDAAWAHQQRQMQRNHRLRYGDLVALEHAVASLLTGVSHKEETIRKCAGRYLIQAADQFPHILFGECLVRLLDLVQTLQVACSAPSTATMQSALDDHALILPDTLAGRQALLKSTRALMDAWLERARLRAPGHLAHVLQAYLRTRGSAVERAGAGAALRISSPAMVLGLVNKSRSDGIVDGFTSMLNGAALPALIARAQHQDAPRDATLALAALCARGRAPLAGVEALGRLPLAHWSAEGLEDALFGWRWVLAERAALVIHDQLLDVVCDAFRETRERCWGLFAADLREPDSPEVDPYGMSSLEPARPDTSALHGVWLTFLRERLSVVSTNSAQAQGLFQVVAESLSVPLCPLRSSVAARFSLLILALQLMNRGARPTFAATLLERVLGCALEWFAYPDAMYLGDDWAHVVAELGQFLELADVVAARAPSDERAPAEEKLTLLRVLVRQSMASISVFHDPLGPHRDAQPAAAPAWDRLASVAWSFSPRVAVFLPARFPAARAAVCRLIDGAPLQVLDVGPAASMFITAAKVASNDPLLVYLDRWEQSGIDAATAVQLLDAPFRHPTVTKFALAVLQSASPGALVFYLPQIVQAMRYDGAEGAVRAFLARAAASSNVVAHQIIWNLQSYATLEAQPAAPVEDPLCEPSTVLLNQVVNGFDAGGLVFYQKQFAFMHSITRISGLLKNVSDKNKKREILHEWLSSIVVDPTAELYLPTNPALTVLSIVVQGAAPMQSAEKTPILVPFVVRDDHTFVRPLAHRPTETGETRVSSAIFKVGDDVRQDVLVIQIIQLLKSAFRQAHLPLFLYPYRVISTTPGCGIIEVVPHSVSRDALGKQIDGSLADYFHKKWPQPAEFRRARQCFIESAAAYSVVSFLLQLKDRHNGNILVDEEGHIVHIDFGFVFDITPGGDLKFERAPFKVSKEMLDVFGDAESLQLFRSLMVRGFLEARKHVDSIVALVALMLETKLRCFKPTTIASLRARFASGKSERKAAKFMLATIDAAFGTMGRVTTNMYDVFQRVTQGIDH